MIKKLFSVLLVLVVFIPISACGVKGDLKLPEKKTQEETIK